MLEEDQRKLLAGVGLTFQVQMGMPFGARVSRVLQPMSGLGRFSNLSVLAGDTLTGYISVK